jgi:hypothetical protein
MTRYTSWILFTVSVVALFLGATLVPDLQQNPRMSLLFLVFIPLFAFLLIVVMPLVNDNETVVNTSFLARLLYRKESKRLRVELGNLGGLEDYLQFIKRIPWPHTDIRTQAGDEVIKLLLVPVLARLDAAQTTAELRQIRDGWQKAYLESGKYDSFGNLASRLRERISQQAGAREHIVRLSEAVRQIECCSTVPELVECALRTNCYCSVTIEQALRAKAAALQLSPPTLA